MEFNLDDSLFTRLEKKKSGCAPNLHFSDSGTEDSQDELCLDKASPTTFVPETPSPVFSRSKNKRERDKQTEADEDNDLKRSRGTKVTSVPSTVLVKPSDITNVDRKAATEKYRRSREKRLASLMSDLGSENESTSQSTRYRYADRGTGYLGWPSDSSSQDSSDDGDDAVLLGALLQEKRDTANMKRTSSKVQSSKKNLETKKPQPSCSKVVDKDVKKCEDDVFKGYHGGKLSDVEFIPMNLNSKKINDAKHEHKHSSESLSNNIITKVGANRSSSSLKNLTKKKVRPSLFDNNRVEIGSSTNRADTGSITNYLDSGSSTSRIETGAIANHIGNAATEVYTRGEPETKPACRYARNPAFHSPISVFDESLAQANASPVDKPFLNKAAKNLFSHPSDNRVVNCDTKEMSPRINGYVHKPFVLPKSPIRTNMVPATPVEHVIDSIDLTRSESPVFFHLEPPPLMDLAASRPFVNPHFGHSLTSPDGTIPLGLFDLAANRRQEFDTLLLSSPSARNRAGSRRPLRVPGRRRSLMNNVSGIASGENGMSPTAMRLMSEVSVSNDASHAVNVVRQMEDDELYALRLQEEMDKEFAMSLHQSEEVYHPHGGAYAAGDGAWVSSPALSPFLQYCRSPVRRRGYVNNRQPISRRRRGAAMAEVDDLYHDDMLDTPYFENNGYRLQASSDRLALMEAHILALLDNSPATAGRRGRRRGNNGGRYLRNIYSPMQDGNDYDELLELAESLGDVKQKGMSKTELGRLPIRKFKNSDKEDTTDCLICMCTYQDGDSLRILPCCHEFHQPCIDKWLKNMATCPICRVDVKNT